MSNTDEAALSGPAPMVRCAVPFSQVNSMFMKVGSAVGSSQRRTDP